MHYAHTCMRVLYLTISYVWVCQAIKFPNDLIGEPKIDCGQGQMTLEVKTRTTNASRIFAKGHHDTEHCYFKGTNKAVFSLSGCNINRQRQLTPRGMAYELTVVVQLHTAFITKVDKAYHIQCFYMESEKRVTAAIDVSPLTTEALNSGHAMPQCMYSLHIGSANGPMVRYARVGDKVWHVWECPSDVYGMLVHSCFVSDGQGNEIMVVDEKGCGVDRFVMQTPIYSDKMTKAQQETHVFKFADKISVGFACQIRLCFRNGDACKGISPPDCRIPGSLERERVIERKKEENQLKNLAVETPNAETAIQPSTTQSTTVIPQTLTPTAQRIVQTTTTTSPNKVTTSDSLHEDLTSDELIVFQTTKTLPTTSNVVTQSTIVINKTLNNNESEELLDEGSGESLDELVDGRGRRNVYSLKRLETTEVDDGMELDVNQELTVLEADQSAHLPGHLTSSPDMEARFVFERQEFDDKSFFCLSSVGFILIMAAFGSMLLVCLAIAMFVCLRARSQRRKRREALVWDRSSTQSTITNAF